MRRIVIAIIASLASLALGDDAAPRLRAARSLKCQFGPGTATQWSSSEPKTSAARFDESVTFDAIDLKRGTVRIIGNTGARDGRVSYSSVGMTISETAPAVVDVTTIFPIYDKSGNFVAVDTRHVNISGAAIVEQYFGTCKQWQ